MYKYLLLGFLQFVSYSYSTDDILSNDHLSKQRSSLSHSLRTSIATSPYHIGDQQLFTYQSRKRSDAIDQQLFNAEQQDSGSPSIASATQAQPEVQFACEIWLHIYAYLGISDIVKLSQVSKEWYGSLNDQTLWKNHATRLMLVDLSFAYQSLPDYKQLVKNFITAELSFTALDDSIAQIDSDVNGVSSNGQVIVGCTEDTTDDLTNIAFAWTAVQGRQSLGYLPNGNWSDAHGANTDGSIIVGATGTSQKTELVEAFRWNQQNGMQNIGKLHEGNASAARSISSNGQIIVGSAQDGYQDNAIRAFRWNTEQGMQSLGTLNSGDFSAAQSMSDNGLIIIGSANDGHDYNTLRAFKWTLKHGIKSLGTLNNGEKSGASGISADGQTIVGWSLDGHQNNIKRAFRWIQDEGMQSLGALEQNGWSEAYAISGDGQVIVGCGSCKWIGMGTSAFRWTAITGIQLLQDVLMSILPVDWQLTCAVGISRDGMVIIGNGEHNRFCQGWRATIPRKLLLN